MCESLLSYLGSSDLHHHHHVVLALFTSFSHSLTNTHSPINPVGMKQLCPCVTLRTHTHTHAAAAMFLFHHHVHLCMDQSQPNVAKRETHCEVVCKAEQTRRRVPRTCRVHVALQQLAVLSPLLTLTEGPGIGAVKAPGSLQPERLPPCIQPPPAPSRGNSVRLEWVWCGDINLFDTRPNALSPHR